MAIQGDVSGRFQHLSGTKTTRNDGGLRLSPTVNGKRVVILGCIDIDGFGPKSLPTDITPPPKTADSSYAKLTANSVATADLEVGQEIQIEHGDSILVLTVASSTSVSGLTISNSTAALFIQGIVDIVSAYGETGLTAEVDEDSTSVCWIRQQTGSGVKRIVVRRSSTDGTAAKISKTALTIQTGSTDPLVGGSLLGFNEPVLVDSPNRAALILRSHPEVGRTNELFPAYSETSVGGGNNIVVSRLDYSWREDEDGNWYPICASTGTIPAEWLTAIGVDPLGVDAADTSLDIETNYIPSKALRALPWVASGDTTTPQVHVDPSGADLRYWAIGKAMDVMQDGKPEIVYMASAPGYINAAKAVDNASVGLYPVPFDILTTLSASVISDIKSRDLPTADNPLLHGAIYDTTEVEPYPFKSLDVLGYGSVATLTITAEAIEATGSVLAGAGFTIEASGRLRTYYYTSTPTAEYEIDSTGAPETSGGRAQLARAVASTINNDSFMTDYVAATASAGVVTIRSKKPGRNGAVKILATRLTRFTMVTVDADETVILTDASGFLPTKTFVCDATPDTALEFDGTGSATAAAAALVAAINANYDENAVWAASEGAVVYLFERTGISTIAVTGTAGQTLSIATDMLGTDAFKVCVRTAEYVALGTSGLLGQFFTANHMVSQTGVKIASTNGDGDALSIAQDGATLSVTCSGSTGLNSGTEYRFDSGDTATGTTNIVAALNRQNAEDWKAIELDDMTILVKAQTPGTAHAVTLTVTGGGDAGTAKTSSLVLSVTGASASTYAGQHTDSVNRSFAHLAAAFSYNTSIDFMSCKAVLALEPADTDLDGTMSLTELQNYVGIERKHLDGQYVDGLTDDGTGIAGFTNMKVLDGTKRTRASAKYPTLYRMWAGKRITTTTSWADVHLLASSLNYSDLPVQDSKGEYADLGAYISIIAEDGLYSGGSAKNFDSNRGAYLTTGAGVYVGAIANKSELISPINLVMPKFATIRDKTAGMRNTLSGLRFVTFHTVGGITKVEDGPTMAYNIDMFNRSDYVRQMTVDIVNRVHSGIRKVAEPFIGRAMGSLMIQDLKTAIDNKLVEYVSMGLLEGKQQADLRVSPEDRILSQARLSLTLTVPGELKTLLVNTTLVPDTAV